MKFINWFMSKTTKHNEVELESTISTEEMRKTIKRLNINKKDVDALLAIKTKILRGKDA